MRSGCCRGWPWKCPLSAMDRRVFRPCFSRVTCLPAPRAARLRGRANCSSVLPPPSHRHGLKQPRVSHPTGCRCVDPLTSLGSGLFPGVSEKEAATVGVQVAPGSSGPLPPSLGNQLLGLRARDPAGPWPPCPRPQACVAPVGRSRPGLMWPRAALTSGFGTGQPQGLPGQRLLTKPLGPWLHGLVMGVSLPNSSQVKNPLSRPCLEAARAGGSAPASLLPPAADRRELWALGFLLRGLLPPGSSYQEVAAISDAHILCLAFEAPGSPFLFLLSPPCSPSPAGRPPLRTSLPPLAFAGAVGAQTGANTASGSSCCPPVHTLSRPHTPRGRGTHTQDGIEIQSPASRRLQPLIHGQMTSFGHRLSPLLPVASPRGAYFMAKRASLWEARGTEIWQGAVAEMQTERGCAFLCPRCGWPWTGHAPP